MFYLVLFFFFKQKTAYEMRISDWSSDVCSSDLGDAERGLRRGRRLHGGDQHGRLADPEAHGRPAGRRGSRGDGPRQGRTRDGGLPRIRPWVAIFLEAGLSRSRPFGAGFSETYRSGTYR